MRDDTENFADAPVSLNEAKAERAADASLWKPRDALIAALRAIDSGEIAPDALVLAYRVQDEGGQFQTRYMNAAADPHVTLGLLEAAKIRLWIGG